MNDKTPFYQEPFFWMLLVLTYAGYALLNWLADQTPGWQDGRLTLRQHVGFLLAPLGVFVVCFLFDYFLVAMPDFWWFFALSLLMLLARPYFRASAEREGVPLKMRQAAHQIV